LRLKRRGQDAPQRLRVDLAVDKDAAVNHALDDADNYEELPPGQSHLNWLRPGVR
jgi:hypothetical protein